MRVFGTLQEEVLDRLVGVTARWAAWVVHPLEPM